MKIIKIGTWDKEGQPVGWEFKGEPGDDKPIYTYDPNVHAIFTITHDDKVLVDRVEIVEWTEERKRIMKVNQIVDRINR